jgi:hypothetical protein
MGRWFFITYVISARWFDGLSALTMKLPRMIVTLKVRGKSADLGPQ